MYKHILIATDGSDVAEKGVDHGLSLAKALGARATIITVTEPFPIAGGGVCLRPERIVDGELRNLAAGDRKGKIGRR